MKLLNTYEDKEKAEYYLSKITGEKRLASERDGTETIYNLFGDATWTNLFLLDMFELNELKNILAAKNNKLAYDKEKYLSIMKNLTYAESAFSLTIPKHWII
ncbi:hypothetical protein LGE98_004091 [Salmonella enterica]|uniref:Uncharacterized protein n=1 Tax=Salmonella enterica TaxID=28901 RepID=A0A5Y7W2P1_SALER|nr:hypothetical protein DOE56_20330 [Salmonella enterica subsp. arizonae serovar 63:g,z51:-]EAN5162323.1 hypothetical protein [Salmonella enterica]ECJ2572843.1 hypothetical protein [Salmonella enterica subsp. arizonae]EDW8125398.1 hypothetical protein [Salmonella enterica subsp. salamae]EJU7776772.1 hypothetical protein [Salmonella enterica subsp. arizonae serovar 6,7:g,z51:-]KSB79907.1 hypothetical protein LFZ51_01520 [Salmonella enterica subsp. arizonae serovar 63:g,z51:- str. So 20/20]HBJ6